MGTTYDQAPADVHQMAREVLEKHHPDLRGPDGAFVTLCILWAATDSDDPTEPAVKLHGYPDVALISIIPYKQRVDKRADAEIIIDRKLWDERTEPQQRAILDHLITYLEIQKDDIGMVKVDDFGRPKLKVRLADWYLKGFRVIATRYGDDAHEVVEARRFQERYGEVALKREEEKLFA